MIFLDLGYQPLANEYLKNTNSKEKKYRLLVDFNKKSKIVSIKKKFSSKKMFKNNYPYRSSMSKTMTQSFKTFAKDLKKKFKKKKILEIGCNDGVFLENFKKSFSLGIEPCSNIAQLSKKRGLDVIIEYWNRRTALKIRKKYGYFDLIYSANTITHIKNLNDVFKSINLVLSDNGTLIIQDPSMLELLKKNAYDQFYNEHIYVFSYVSLSKLLDKHNLYIYKIKNISEHGGSIRYFIKKKISKKKIDNSVKIQLKREIKFGLKKFNTYKKFGFDVNKSKNNLKNILANLRKLNKKVIGYGATAKAVTVLNYCNIGNDIIKFFYDTTPEKHNKFIPGVKIPVKKYRILNTKEVDYAFLGAWNFKKEIFQKEKKFLKSGGKFITHIPKPRILSY
tara:strand:+ start:2437 stop:3612 length:1176 start_codon:yes stop_codon:yes gene_type:complete